MFEDIQKHRQAVRENIEKSFQIGYTENEDFEKAHKVGDIHPNGKWVWTQLPSGKFDWRVIKLDKPGGNRALNQISDKQRQTYEEIENLINHGKRLTTAQANFYNNLKPSMDKLKKQSQSTVPSQQNVNKQQKTEDGLTKEELEELRALESAARKGYKLLQRDANRLRRLQAKERELKQEKLMATQSQKTEEGKEVEVDKNSSEYKKAFSAAKRWASEIDERGREVELSAIKENLEAAKKIAENKDGKWSRNDVIRAKNSIVSETARKDAFEDVEKELKKKTEKKGKEGTKPIVPNAVLQYGNLPSRQFDQLYKDFDLQFKSYTKEQLSQAIDKIGDSVSKQISLYKRMKANGDSKIALNKQGNFIDQLSARVYTLKRLLNEKEK